ncbi:hypothetical protein CFE70_003389 [Pyrenophora teres f. teres 0-1]|uniref:Uncharacterized protein n=1 Tax=Pyrenophora teres f. teres TaxID=97479 RepID=A0A6S6VEK7_9PLEO|nr:hypothetical protein HRS9139_00706 [Pyrenophora teres f. teres]KAE8848279.1 hypothetical protein PTNB85_02122 [Pyrenophora teres f. teres]KAE8853555.1 hypothetical protein HRS9122_00547 [Pyrenophora teres f. teres]KAE8868204.1 hypothetical protein PTNB29_02115 [Pyrenophora teres f. teres]KAE8872969.1 hypothetical protein PTNB73_02120 [Pyrenophora teres f. teres]
MYLSTLAVVLFASTALATTPKNNTVIKNAAPTEASATTLVTLVSSASSTSTATANPGDMPAGVYVCSNINWGGICEHKFTPLGGSDSDCTVLTGRESSVGPDEGFFCEFYTYVLASLSSPVSFYASPLVVLIILVATHTVASFLVMDPIFWAWPGLEAQI